MQRNGGRSGQSGPEEVELFCEVGKIFVAGDEGETETRSEKAESRKGKLEGRN